jgi:hypothetical protein
VPHELYTILRGCHSQERLGPPKFFDVSLPACHGLRTPADLPILAKSDALVLPSVCVKTLGVRNKRHVEAVPALQGTRLPLRPTGYAVYASSILFAMFEPMTPPWTQDAIRVGGSPLPDRDSHPARDAKLSWRNNAAAQPRLEAPGSQGMLPYPSPLRTVHERHPSHGSSPCCLLSMSLVVRVMTPPMHTHAVLLAIVTALVFGGDVVSVDRIAGVERPLA